MAESETVPEVRTAFGKTDSSVISLLGKFLGNHTPHTWRRPHWDRRWAVLLMDHIPCHSKLTASPRIQMFITMNSFTANQAILPRDTTYSVLLATHVCHYFPGNIKTTSLIQLKPGASLTLYFWFIGDSNNACLHFSGQTSFFFSGPGYKTSQDFKFMP